jgi:hypothetical protein
MISIQNVNNASPKPLTGINASTSEREGTSTLVVTPTIHPAPANAKGKPSHRGKNRALTRIIHEGEKQKGPWCV